MLEERIINTKKEIIEYTTLIEEMMRKFLEGFRKKNKELINVVIEEDEPITNAMEINLEEKCTNIIARFQPRAKDLRTLLMIYKMNNDLERIGDHIVNVCESTQVLIDRNIKYTIGILPKMVEKTIELFKDSITSFINEDSEMAMEVCERDDEIDDFRNKIWEELMAKIHSKKPDIDYFVHMARISRNLERIADLSTNISEDVIYLVDGRVIKHRHDSV